MERRATAGEGVTRMNGTFELECMEDDLTHELNFVEWQGLKNSGSGNGHREVARPSEQLRALSAEQLSGIN